MPSPESLTSGEAPLLSVDEAPLESGLLDTGFGCIDDGPMDLGELCAVVGGDDFVFRPEPFLEEIYPDYATSSVLASPLWESMDHQKSLS